MSSVEQWYANRGPQYRFLRSKCFEILFGGAAGGGKTDSLLAGAARFVNHRRYRAVIARRTVPELEGTDGIIERSFAMYQPLGARYLISKKRWVFPSGARIGFIHCESEADVRNFGGWQFQFLGIDELTTFTKTIYEFLIGRLRSTAGIPCVVRSTSNPGGPGHSWVLERFRWWLYRSGMREDEFSGPYLDPSEPAWILRDPDTGKDSLVAAGTPHATRRVFIPARLSDNPHLANTDYGDRLRMLDPLTRRQLKEGDWMATAEPGMFWDRAWVTERLVRAPDLPKYRVRFWDLAATDDESGKKDPAWTCGVRMSMLHDDTIVVEDVARCRKDPGGVIEFLGETMAADKASYGNIDQVIAQDPGQAGKFEIETLASHFKSFNVRGLRETGDKVTRFKPFSAKAFRGEVAIVSGRWNGAYHDELEAFPPKSKKQKADQADASSGAFEQLQRGAFAPARTGGNRQMARAGGGF